MTFLAAFTAVHVAISLAAIASGFVVAAAFVRGQTDNKWTTFFLTTTVLTSLTGFGFPFHGVTPGHVFGVLSLVSLGVATFALRNRHLAGHWRAVYVVNALFSLYLNVFVLIVQSFQKVPALKELAPTQTEAPFAAVQLLTLAGFLVLGMLALSRSRKIALASSLQNLFRVLESAVLTSRRD